MSVHSCSILVSEIVSLHLPSFSPPWRGNVLVGIRADKVVDID